MNDGGEVQRTTYDHFVDGFPSRLRLHKAWWSKKQRSVPLTVATALNPLRLDQLAAQCNSWGGPLSAAVYLVLHDGNGDALSPPSRQSLLNAEGHTAELFEEMERAGRCQLDVMLLYETVRDEVMKHLLPINTMRNYALLQARTPLVAMVDTDLLVSSSLYEWLSVPDNSHRLLRECASRSLFVLPAFETPHNANVSEAHDVARRASDASKRSLARMVQRRLVHQFALYLFQRGHNATNYLQWFVSGEPYAASWAPGYEPWFIIHRHLNPWYDDRFRGYGWNKVTHVHNTAHSNFTFKVHPHGFIVHRQHSRSTADQMYQSQKKVYEKEVREDPTQADKQKTLAGITHKFRNQVMKEVEEGKYQPVLDAGVLQCLKTLPWWSAEDRRATLSQR